MFKTTRTNCKNFGDRLPSLRPKPINVRRTLLFAGAIAAAASTQPEPAHAGGDGAAIALGIIGGIIVGAVAANANRPPQSYYPQQPAYAGNSAACQSWLAVLDDPRYDAATRAQAQQIVSACGLPTSGSDTRSTVASGYSGSAPAYAPAAAPSPAPRPQRSEIPLMITEHGHYLNGTVNGIPVVFQLDTGADGIVLSNQAAATLGLTARDIVGSASVTGVNGRSQEPIVILRELNIGGYVLRNVKSTVGKFTLLGQRFLGKLGTYTVDNRRGVLVLN